MSVPKPHYCEVTEEVRDKLRITRDAIMNAEVAAGGNQSGMQRSIMFLLGSEKRDTDTLKTVAMTRSRAPSPRRAAGPGQRKRRKTLKIISG